MTDANVSCRANARALELEAGSTEVVSDMWTEDDEIGMPTTFPPQGGPAGLRRRAGARLACDRLRKRGEPAWLLTDAGRKVVAQFGRDET